MSSKSLFFSTNYCIIRSKSAANHRKLYQKAELRATTLNGLRILSTGAISYNSGIAIMVCEIRKSQLVMRMKLPCAQNLLNTIM